VRSTVVLPNGTGKEPRVPVFAVGDAARIAEASGADHVGADDLVKRIQEGWLEFDATIAMADQMGKVGGLGRILGRRGLMPNPRSGTVVRTAEDLPNVINELKGGRVEFRNDRTGLLHVGIGKRSFDDDKLVGNLYALVDAVQRAKPTGAKGVYCRSITLASTMSPGIPLDVNGTLASAAQAASA
jgi:large subunit ribosomal protein L1